MIVFTRSAYDAIVDHAVDGIPHEICGVLGGEYDEDRSVVTRVEPAANVSETPETRYYMDPAEQLERIDDIEEDGAAVAGFYHSHPAGPTLPSETDADRATWPGYSYVIVALDGQPYVGSWRWSEDTGRFEQEIVRIE